MRGGGAPFSRVRAAAARRSHACARRRPADALIGKSRKTDKSADGGRNAKPEKRVFFHGFADANRRILAPILKPGQHIRGNVTEMFRGMIDAFGGVVGDTGHLFAEFIGGFIHDTKRGTRASHDNLMVKVSPSQRAARLMVS